METGHKKNQYIWVSFAQEDASLVLPILQIMKNDGFRLAWDEGRENRQEKIANSGYCMVFLSGSYLASDRCLEMLDQTRELEKQHLLIYLEDVELPPGIAMRIGRNQAIFYSRYKTRDAFLAKVYEAQNIRCFAGDSTILIREEKNVKRTSVFRKRRIQRLLIVAAILLLAAVLAAVILLQPEETPGEDPSREASQETHQEKETEPPVSYTPTEEDMVILDTEKAFAAIRPGTYGEDGNIWECEVVLINRTEEEMLFSLGYEMMNAHAVSTDWQEMVEPNVVTTSVIRFSYLTWLDTDYDRVLSYSGTLTAGREEGVFALFPEGEAAAEDLQMVQIDPSQIVFENDAVCVAYLGVANYPDFPYPRELFCVQNKLDRMQDIMFSASGMEPGVERLELLPQSTRILNWSRNEGVTETTLEVQFWNRQFGDYETVTDIQVALEVEEES